MAKDSRCVHAQTKNLERGQAAEFTESEDSGTRDAGRKARDEDISPPARQAQLHFSPISLLSPLRTNASVFKECSQL